MGGKTWIAGVKLETKHDRLMIGVAGRLADGKPWNQITEYRQIVGCDGSGYELISRSASGSTIVI